MAEYGIIYKKQWRQENFVVLDDDAQKLLFYLQTGPHGNMSGIFYFHIYQICAERSFQWLPERATKSFNDLLKYEWIQYDNANKIVLINNWFDEHFLNANMLKKALAELSELPYSPLLKIFITQLDSKNCLLTKGIRQSFKKSLGERFPQCLPESLPPSVTDDEDETGSVTEGREIPLHPDLLESVDYESFVNLFNDLCPSLPRVAKITDARRDRIKKRWKEYPNWESWRTLFARIEASKFLIGKAPGKDGGEPFIASFDWILEPKNLTKIIEGNYDNRGNGQRPVKAGTDNKQLADKYRRFDGPAGSTH